MHGLLGFCMAFLDAFHVSNIGCDVHVGSDMFVVILCLWWCYPTHGHTPQ